MMPGRLWPKYLELRRSSVDVRDGYYLSTKICLVIITVLA